MSGYSSGFFSVARLTWLELQRRRIVLASLVGGAVLLLVFAIAVYLIHNFHRPAHPLSILESRAELQLASLAGFYAANLLAVAVAVVLPLDLLSGEIASGVMQTIASKPIRRWEILLAKFMVFWLVIAAYIAIIVSGVVFSMRLITGFSQPHAVAAAGLLVLEATVLLCVVVAGGVRLTTVSNGMVAFSLYAVAVVGGWIEQIGVTVGNSQARYVGTAISLLSPTDALWRRALNLLAPPVLSQVQTATYLPASVPSVTMVWWSVGFSVCALALAVRWFETRQL
jgi:Cu-processing system permease protein